MIEINIKDNSYNCLQDLKFQLRQERKTLQAESN